MTPAPPVGYNITFACPEGEVFDQDWFATPSIMMTCQVTSCPDFVLQPCLQENGMFDLPAWELHQCVRRKLMVTMCNH